MSNIIKIKKGLDVPIGGKASDEITQPDINLYGIVPDDFPGFTWKAAVKAGDEVKVGSPLLFAKEDEEMSLTSPVAGKVIEIHRGERRKIEYISVEKTGDSQQETIKKDENSKLALDELKKSGLFAYIRQRPFDIVANPAVEPRDIFVTGFDSSPLAPALLTSETNKYLEAGLKVLSDYTSGKVYLALPKGTAFSTQVATVYEFEGPHPAGNVGTQIAAIKPVNKGETVWATDVITVARIGRLAETGELDFTTLVALTGDEVKNPHLIKTLVGASIEGIIKGELKDNDTKKRIISGSVLTGHKVEINDGFLRFPYRQITVIEEGDNADEFMGWASMNPGKFSVKRSFPAFLKGAGKPFKFDSRIKGGHRAMIMSGEYDKVFPMDIYPEYLIKAIMAKDIDRMEKLGIYEVAPEDFALPEFVDTSKIELQKIVREGLDYLRKETE